MYGQLQGKFGFGKFLVGTKSQLLPLKFCKCERKFSILVRKKTYLELLFCTSSVYFLLHRPFIFRYFVQIHGANDSIDLTVYQPIDRSMTREMWCNYHVHATAPHKHKYLHCDWAANHERRRSQLLFKSQKYVGVYNLTEIEPLHSWEIFLQWRDFLRSR